MAKDKKQKKDKEKKRKTNYLENRENESSNVANATLKPPLPAKGTGLKRKKNAKNGKHKTHDESREHHETQFAYGSGDNAPTVGGSADVSLTDADARGGVNVAAPTAPASVLDEVEPVGEFDEAETSTERQRIAVLESQLPSTLYR